MDTFTHIALWFIAIFVGVSFEIIANDPIHYLLAQIFGGLIPRRKRVVEGLWYSTYSYEEDGHEYTENQIIELRQFGNYVVGKNLTANVHWYKIRGKIQQEIYFTGTWSNVIDDDIYHGAFQFVLEPEGNKMEGKWLGFNRHHHINHGPWYWYRISKNLDNKSREEALNFDPQLINATNEKNIHNGELNVNQPARK